MLAAYGSSVCAHRVLLELTRRVTPYAASTGTNRSACRSPPTSSGRSRSSFDHDFRDLATP